MEVYMVVCIVYIVVLVLHIIMMKYRQEHR